MASPRDPARLRRGLNPLTTGSLAPHAVQLSSPISALSMTSPPMHSAQTPGSAIQPYNPREWVSSPAPLSERSRHFHTDAQASPPPPPPPPYSPPRSRQPRPMSTAFEHTIASVSTSPLRNMQQHRLSPEPRANRSFPPPPGASRTAGSRERRFGLPSLGRRKDHDQQLSSSPDPQPPVLPGRRSMGPSPSHPEDRTASPACLNAQTGPPAARRAASTGAIGTPTSARSRSTSHTRWEPGMPLPPPPPGPPPSGSRSQSVLGTDRDGVPIVSPPTRRPPPSGVSSLGPVPPTPSDWVDDDTCRPIPSFRGRPPVLTIDTSAAAASTDVAEPLATSPRTAALNRARAVRHDKTIIQRRAESRSRHAPHGSIDAVASPQPISDIVVPTNSDGCALAASGSNPRSSRTQPESARAGESWAPQYDSRNSTPRAATSATKLSQFETATPPFSPYPAKLGQPSSGSQSVAPKALPTPPPQARSASSSRPRDASRPPTTATTPASRHSFVALTPEQFGAAAVERFRDFAAKEAAAPTDAHRVRMFADFIVHESRIRRERYASAIGAMGSEILDLTRDLFRPLSAASRRDSGNLQDDLTPASTASQSDHAGTNFRVQGMSSSAPASANLPASPSGVGGGPPANANWVTNYMPSLSPILSLSVSDNYENGSSRGRPPSRWWEADSQGDTARVFERSKRESKYMGVPKDQWAEKEPSAAAHGGRGGSSGDGSAAAAAAAASDHGSSFEYPPEKAGWYGPEEPLWTPQSLGPSASPSSYKTEALDVSRLVTMPPPYPRHHPAVNNNHPELAAMRSAVRALSDLAEMDRTKERFAMASSERRANVSKAAAERQQSLRANLQKEINAGNLGYADAAAIESDSQDQERESKKEQEKTEYEHFQSEVILPLNDLLTGRIASATDLFDDLSRRLFDSGQMDADMPQEEGDDRPELLEKLTLLKWIFETRETLHRAIYDLLSDRNRRYCEVVVTPYRLSGNTDKLASAEAFFAEDAAKREHAYANEVLGRAREFRAVVQEAVERGVALQLSAFWDIAPPLRQLLDSIPADLEGFSIQIAASELEENPAYLEHPLQYLYSLVQHAEKSTHQFIESHTNLLCLLHEVREAVVNAKARVLATQAEEADGTTVGAEERERRAQAMRQVEDRRLTEDLKEKVRVVQDQWSSALGEGIKNVKERVGAWLLRNGGWDETLEESAGFGVV